MTAFTKKNPYSILKNKIFIFLIGLYITLLLFVSFMACFFSYGQKKEALLSQINNSYLLLKEDYRSIVNNFWQIYMPFFEDQNRYKEIWDFYFLSESKTTLTPFQKQDLNAALRSILLRDNNIQWVVLYNSNRNDNYILYNDSSALTTLPEDFPYLEELNSSSLKMEVYGMRPFEGFSSVQNTFALCGNIPSKISGGKLMVGYGIGNFQSICQNVASDIPGLNYVLSNNNEIIFDAGGDYEEESLYAPAPGSSGTVRLPDGRKIFTCSQTCGLNTSVICYTISSAEILRYCHANTPLLIAIPLLFAIISIAGYIFLLHLIGKEVSTIHYGLKKIGENHLDYKLPVKFTQDSLSEIAESINQMTAQLQNTINRAYYYELKQKEAELSELQSKFNPHFLYNTLEMLRSRCQINGDQETADLISQLAMIFRGFIGSKNFIPLTEELTFSKRYLALFGARYEGKIAIRYHFDKELLQYGIIRNLFQPLIENYFVHGFDTSNENNYILFSGKSLDEDTMELTVEDNGSGMTPEEISALNARLHEPVQIDTESYGLKNLHQRLHLFYGGNCGLTIYSNPHASKGISIQIIAKKMKVAEVTDKVSR